MVQLVASSRTTERTMHICMANNNVHTSCGHQATVIVSSGSGAEISALIDGRHPLSGHTDTFRLVVRDQLDFQEFLQVVCACNRASLPQIELCVGIVSNAALLGMVTDTTFHIKSLIPRLRGCAFVFGPGLRTDLIAGFLVAIGVLEDYEGVLNNDGNHDSATAPELEPAMSFIPSNVYHRRLDQLSTPRVDPSELLGTATRAHDALSIGQHILEQGGSMTESGEYIMCHE